MKHIIFTIRWPVSGIRNYIKYTFKSETFKDYRFTIIAPDTDFSEFAEKSLGPMFNYVPCDGTAWSMMKTLIGECRKDPAAQIHAHGFTAIVYSVLPALLYRRKLLGTAHDIFTPKQFRGKTGTVKKILLGVLLNFPKATIAVSNDCKANILRYLPLVSERKLYPVLNGIDAETFAKTRPRNLKGELGLAEDILLVGFLGRFSAQKGFKYIIDAVKKLDESGEVARLKIICFGWGGFIREEQEVIEKLGLSSYFIFHPFVDDVAAVIKGLDLVLMPSLWEACGILAMEVLACGTPLIASDCEGLREVVSGTPATVVQMRNAEELARAVKLYLENNNLKESFVDYAQIAQSRYDAGSTTSPQTLKVYKDALGG